MRILGLGRAKTGDKAAAAAERHEPTIDPGSEEQIAATNAEHDRAHAEGDPAKLEAARNQTLATIGGCHGAAATMYTLLASTGHDVDLSDGTLNQLCEITE